MVVNSINIVNNLPAHRAKIINILDFNSEKISVIRNNNDKTFKSKIYCWSCSR